MNKLTLAAIATSLTFSSPLFADDAHHPEKAPEGKSISAKPATKSQTPSDRQLATMTEQMKKTQALMGKIQKTTDAAERNKLLQEHMALMHEGMTMMQGMGGGMMMGMMGGGMGMGGTQGGMMGGGMGGTPQGRSMAPEMMQQRLEFMQNRMDMMQMMMGQMLEHQQVEQPMKK